MMKHDADAQGGRVSVERQARRRSCRSFEGDPMPLRALLLIASTVAMAAAADDATTTPPESIEEQLLTVTLTAPPTGKATQDGPAEVAALLKDGWYVTTMTALGPAADGKGFTVAVVLDRKHAADSGGAPEGGDEPGRGDPIEAAKPGEYHLTWQDGHTTTVVIDDPQGVRSPATVTTSDPDGSLAVSYPATAFVDGDGVLEIDARGEPLSGPQAEHYSPDSFAIARDGSVTTMDDNGQANKAKLDEPKSKPPVESEPKRGRRGSDL
jgi:hypothetical protein